MNGDRSRLGCSSARPRAEHRCEQAHQTESGLRVSSGPRGRGPLRPRRARSPRQLHCWLSCTWRYFFSDGGGNSKPSRSATSAQPFGKRGRKARGKRFREKSVERLTIRVVGPSAKISISDIHCKTESSISSARCLPSAPDTAVAKLLVMLKPMVESRCRVYCATTSSFGSCRSV